MLKLKQATIGKIGNYKEFKMKNQTVKTKEVLLLTDNGFLVTKIYESDFEKIVENEVVYYVTWTDKDFKQQIRLIDTDEVAFL